jgi:hypothetical protein
MIKTFLYVVHGMLLTATIIASVRLEEFLPSGKEKLSGADAFGVWTAVGVFLSAIATALYFESDIAEDAPGNAIILIAHGGVVMGLVWAWATYIPLLA